MRVLVVDDSKTMRNIVKRMLGELGYTEIEEAGDGREALDKAAAFKPELILLDWSMPNMDGIGFLRAFRGQGQTTPVVVVANDAEKPRVIEAFKAGVSNYVLKPFTPEVLEKRIGETLAKQNAA